MSYIPIVPYVPAPEPSPRARRLAVELEDTIERFEQDQGALDDLEVRQALGIVERSTAGSACGSAVAIKLALVSACALGVLVLGLVLARGGGLPMLGRVPVVMGLVLGLLAVGAVVAFATAKRN